MTRLFYIGLLGQLLVSCINMNNPLDQAQYIEERGKFDKSLVKLFPDRLPNNMVSFGFTQPYERIPGGLHLTIKYFSGEEYLQNKMRYAKQSRYHTNSKDNCLFIVDEYEGMNQKKCENFCPVPARAIFGKDLYDKTRGRLPDSEVFFIDIRPGDFIKDGKNHSRVDLPANWLHGYSTGITTNDNNRTIQFWLVAW